MKKHNSIISNIKNYLINIKYFCLFLKRNFKFNPKSIDSVKSFKKFEKIVISGNSLSYKIFEKEFLQGKYPKHDILMLNYGPLNSKLSVNFHIFEMPGSDFGTPKEIDFEIDQFISKMKKTKNNTCRIFRPRNKYHIKKVRKNKLKDLFIIKEKRIRQNSKKLLYKDLIKIKSDSVLFCRSSIIYATLFAIRLGYREILYTGINPENDSSFCSFEKKTNSIKVKINNSEFHPTFKKVGGLNSYDILKLISNFKGFSQVKFKIHKNSFNFLQ